MSRALAIFWIALLCEGLLMSLAAKPDLTKRWFFGGTGCSGSRPAGHDWCNKWDKPFLFECPQTQSISSIYSIYRDCRKDRLYELKCNKNPDAGSSEEDCYWSEDVNNFYEPIAFVCPYEMYLAGVDSCDQNNKGDRRFKFKCCGHKSKCRRSNGCYKTSLVNSYKGVLDYKVPQFHYLVGVYSVHDNSQADRRWQFEVCRIPPKHKKKPKNKHKGY